MGLLRWSVCLCLWVQNKGKDEEPKQLSCRFLKPCGPAERNKNTVILKALRLVRHTHARAHWVTAGKTFVQSLWRTHIRPHTAVSVHLVSAKHHLSPKPPAATCETHYKVITARRELTSIISLAFCRHLSTQCCKHWMFQKNPKLIPKFSGQPLLADPGTHAHTQPWPGEQGHGTPDTTLPCQNYGLIFLNTLDNPHRHNIHAYTFFFIYLFCASPGLSGNLSNLLGCFQHTWPSGLHSGVLVWVSVGCSNLWRDDSISC